MAAERLSRPLRYYADIPYVLRKPELLAPAIQGMESQRYPVSEAGLQAWLEGSAAYQSQMVMVFETEAKMRTAMCAEWESRHGIDLNRQGFHKVDGLGI